ncbi:MAG: S1 RNA-binding domain-containing protein, partial [Phycisphaeraceae bacterium]|nr:S1 RNA-binding domain-containing protein [Phycisphaeraceae bacterium]
MNATPDLPDDLQADVDKELEAALGSADSLDELMDASFTEADARPAGDQDLLTGRVVNIDDNEILIEPVGGQTKHVGVVPREQFDEDPEVGAELEFEVRRFDSEAGVLRLSRQGAVTRATWEALEPGLDVKATVESANDGGLAVKIGAAIDAFMPASHVSLGRVEDLETMVGKTLEAKVIEFDRRSKRVIVSHRAWAEQQRDRRLDELNEDAVVEGSVTRLDVYGAFVDIGGFEGLLHISEMDLNRVVKPSDV